MGSACRSIGAIATGILSWPIRCGRCGPMASNARWRLVTSAYSSYSGCRQYRENIAAAQAEVGEGAPAVDKLRVFYNHPGFVEASVSARARGIGSSGPKTNGRQYASSPPRIASLARWRKRATTKSSCVKQRDWSPKRLGFARVGPGLSKPQWATDPALA